MSIRKMDSKEYLCGAMLGLIIGFSIAIFVAGIFTNNFGNAIMIVDVLDEVCVQLYGNETEAYVPNIMVEESELRCRRILEEPEEILNQSKVRLIG